MQTPLCFVMSIMATTLLGKPSFAADPFRYHADTGRCENSQHQTGLNIVDPAAFLTTGNGECGDFTKFHSNGIWPYQALENSNFRGAELGHSVFTAIRFINPDFSGAKMMTFDMHYGVIQNGTLDSFTQIKGGYCQTRWEHPCIPDAQFKISCIDG